MILVRVRCAKCWTILHKVERRPESWEDDDLLVMRCRRCDMPDPTRIVDVLIRKGLDSMGLMASVPWATLRPSIEKAERTGKTQDHGIRVLDHPDDG